MRPDDSYPSVPIPVVQVATLVQAIGNHMTFSSPQGTGAPASGDVLIVKDSGARKALYVLSIVPNPGQIRCQTYEQAVSTARRWASLQQVAIWFSEDGSAFTIVSPASGATPSPSAERAREAE